MLTVLNDGIGVESVQLNEREKQLLVLKQFHEAASAYENHKLKDFSDLNAQAKYVLAAESYNAINRTHGSGQPDILVLPISEVIDLYDFDGENSGSVCVENDNTAMIFDLNPTTNQGVGSNQENRIVKEVEKYAH